ncbi:hypothetical protein HPB50_017502 [Hyalomma asiaticum]|uniref:Uncharacterized protein n=1 Tax=Hyalomma asiaticum TaxID=266040 RepID=A0ACB7TM19_HYAAI|nr:hypothetical protein HPB50_017502 [Hyalomma asiaticum]
MIGAGYKMAADSVPTVTLSTGFNMPIIGLGTWQLWCTFYTRARAVEGCQLSLKLLGLEYLDLYLMHWPFGYKDGDDYLPRDAAGEIINSDVDYVEVWKVECHPYLNQSELLNFCRENNMALTAYSPLGSPERPWANPDEPTLLEDPVIKSIAESHGKTAAQRTQPEETQLTERYAHINTLPASYRSSIVEKPHSFTNEA